MSGVANSMVFAIVILRKIGQHEAEWPCPTEQAVHQADKVGTSGGMGDGAYKSFYDAT